jgi:acetolactate synthase I/II/III large subunit
VAVIGDTHRDHSWKNMTQEARQLEILRPAAKEVLRIESPQRIPELMRRAFMIATTGRPGPVVVDVPEDVCHGRHGYEEGDFEVDPIYTAAPALRCRPDAASIERAARALAEARRPILLAGGGAHLSRAAETVAAFAEAFNLPVGHTMTGKGAIACTSPLSAGLFGRYDRIANGLIAEADLILVVGCKLGEIATRRYTLPPNGKRIVHVDIDPGEIGRTLAPDMGLWGDVRETVRDLGAALATDAARIKERQADYAAEVAQRMAAWRASVAERLASDETPVSMARLVNELNALMPADGILVADGGFAAHWAGLLYDTKRPGRGFVPDRGFASIGYGLPGAVGAATAAPHRTVVGLTGDGGFNMMIGELEKARRLALDLTVIVVNNAASGYVKALQHLMYGAGTYHASDLAETDYAKVAEAMGCRGVRVERPADLAGALKSALAAKGPAIVDVVVTRDPAKMLPAVDNRTVEVKKGDRVA